MSFQENFQLAIDDRYQPNIFETVKFGSVGVSVTRLGDILHFGQPFKVGGNNYFAQIAHIVRQFL